MVKGEGVGKAPKESKARNNCNNKKHKAALGLALSKFVFLGLPQTYFGGGWCGPPLPTFPLSPFTWMQDPFPFLFSLKWGS